MAENKIPIAKAYVEIIPSMQGAKKAISEDLGVEVEKSGKKGGEKFGTKFSEGFKTAAKAVGAAAVAVTSAAVAGVVSLTKSAVESYGEFEQLSGGAELMYGEAYDFIMDKSEQAYKSVQMSQNAYLQQVNGFATGLKTALGGDAQMAAELADKIVTAEADVVAATGASQESVQNAFNGIMKSNYTMLDNLQLGITPTKEGFQEVINKVNEWNAAQGNATEYSIESLADSEAALVDYIKMVGVAGYAQEEGSKTIQGSLSSLKGAWSNLLTGLGNDSADFDSLIDGVVNSTLNVVGNIEPVALKAVRGISKLISGIAPVVAEKLPPIVNELLPSLSSAVISLVSALASPDVVTPIMNSLSKVITALLPVFMRVLPIVLGSVFQLIMSVVNWLSTGDNVANLTNGVVRLVSGLVNQFAMLLPVLLPAVVSILSECITTLTSPENTELLVDAALTLLGAVVVALAESLPVIGEMVLGVIENLGETLGDFFLWAVPIVATGIGEIVDTVKSWGNNIKSFISNLINSIKTSLSNWINTVNSTFTNGFNSIKTNVSNVINSVKTTVTNGIKNIVSSATTWGKDLLSNFISGIKSKLSNLKSTVSNVAQTVRNIIGFSEPKEGPLSNFHTYAPDMIDLFTEGMYENRDQIGDAFEDVLRLPNLDAQVNANGISSEAFGTTNTINGGSISINVYGAEGQDVNSLAEVIAYKLEAMTKRRGVVYA